MTATGMGEYLADSTDYREGAFRFGKQITYDALKKHYYRDDVTYFLCRGLIEEAIGKGFHVTEAGEEDDSLLDWDEDLQEMLDIHMPELVRALSIERRDGRVFTAFMKNGAELYFRSFTQEFYKANYDKYGRIESAFAKTSILGYRYGVVSHSFESDAALSGIREIILRRREKLNSGMSYMEPIWDISIALYFVASHIAYHVARAGAGNKVFEQETNDATPIDPLDDDAIDDIIEKAANFSSSNDIMWLPPGVKLNENLFNSAGQVRWMEIFDILCARLSIMTGIPSSRLKGLVPGQLVGAEVSEEGYFDVLRDIQESVKPYLKWFVRKIAEFYGFIDENDTFDILFNVREEMSEEDTILLTLKRLELAQKYIDLGVKKDKAFELAGLEITMADLDMEEMQKREEEREALLTVDNKQSQND